MGNKTKIEWTEATWNPVRGCSIVSEGCRNCYAMRQAHRANRPTGAYEGLTRIGAHGPTWTGDVRFVPEMLAYPLRLRKPHRIFVNSMSDLFHEKVTDEQIDKIFAVMSLAPRHTFQVLTKRPERMKRYMRALTGERLLVTAWENQLATPQREHAEAYAGIIRGESWPLSNVWLGISAENQDTADDRIPYLLNTPAAVRWLSLEPLLGPIDLQAPWSAPNIDYPALGIHWVVVGGESGPGARPTHPDWVRSIRDQCAGAGVPFFFKQWGRWCESWGCDDPCGKCIQAMPDGTLTGPDWEAGRHLVGAVQMDPLGKKTCGNLLDGRQYLEYPK